VKNISLKANELFRKAVIQNQSVSVRIGIGAWHGKLFAVCALILVPGWQRAVETMVTVFQNFVEVDGASDSDNIE